MFTIGGSTGIILSSNVMDIALHDTYYVVSHFHMVLSLGTIISLLSGISMFQDHLLVCYYLSFTISRTSILSITWLSLSTTSDTIMSLYCKTVTISNQFGSIAFIIRNTLSSNIIQLYTTAMIILYNNSILLLSTHYLIVTHIN